MAGFLPLARLVEGKLDRPVTRDDRVRALTQAVGRLLDELETCDLSDDANEAHDAVCLALSHMTLAGDLPAEVRR